MKFGFSIKHHDHAYVESRGGWELLTHLRGAPARVRYRREAIGRALTAYKERMAQDGATPATAGAGLVVLQRALLAAEDLGGMLHAFAGPDPWARLRRTSLPDIDAAFTEALVSPRPALHSAFRLPTSEQLADEALEEADREAFTRLTSLVADRWSRMLATSAHLWLANAAIAKATMHGMPVLAAEHILGPPGAGELSAGTQWPLALFAVVLTSTVSGTHVASDRQAVLLDLTAVRAWHREGRLASKLYGELCEGHAGSIMRGYAAMVPTDLARQLPSELRQRVEQLARHSGEGSDGQAA